MKIIIFSIFVSVTVYLAYKSATNNPTYQACHSAASVASEKMWECGMVRYEGVADMRERLFSTFSERKISGVECADFIHMIGQQNCQQYETMVNTLAFQSQMRNQR